MSDATGLPAEAIIDQVENICVATADVRILFLAATSFGLAAKWRTDEVERDPEIKVFFGFAPE